MRKSEVIVIGWQRDDDEEECAAIFKPSSTELKIVGYLWQMLDVKVSDEAYREWNRCARVAVRQFKLKNEAHISIKFADGEGVIYLTRRMVK